MLTWPRAGTGIILCLALFPVIFELLLSALGDFLISIHLTQIVDFTNFKITIEVIEKENASGSNMRLSWALVFIASGLTLFFRKSVACIFFLFHLALALLSAILGIIPFSPLVDKYLLVERAVNFSFVIILLSQIAFLSFSNPSLFSTIRLIFSILISSLALVIGSTLLGIFTQTSDGPLLILLTYIILSYGVFGIHLISLTVLMQSKIHLREV